MKVSYPLSFKISLWLLLNLLLLAVAGIGVYWAQFGRGWDSVLQGAMGDRLQAVADSIMAEGLNGGESAVRAAIASREENTGAEFFVFRNEGVQVFGRTVRLPEAMRTEMTRGPRRGPQGEGPPPGEGPLGERPPPPPGKKGYGSYDEPPPGKKGGYGAYDDGPPMGKKGGFGPPNRGPLGSRTTVGRMLIRTENPSETWIGLRVPLHREYADPAGPGTLIIRAPNLLAMLRLFDALPWLGVLAGAFALSVLFWLPLIGGITRALGELTRATEAIAEGRFDARVPDTRHDELGHLGQSVNRMASRLETLVNGQKRFLGDVAHELGSPLGRLQVATEILEARATNGLRAYVHDVREEVQQMSVLVNELLAFTKAGMRPRTAELAPVELDSLVTEVIAREDPKSSVHVALAPGLRVRADHLLLGRALGNLVRNALRYAGAEAVVSIRIRQEGGNVFITVEDDGPGVPPESLSRLGEPFFRPESARTRESGGAGLGLAIVRSSIIACGGEVQFANRTPRGFRAEIRLALA